MKHLPAINLTGSTRFTYYSSRIMLVGFLLVLIFLIFAPWRQFVRGTGSVIAFNPLDRRVNVDSLVAGRVKQLHIVEGQRVQQGDLIVEIQDNDPNLLENLRSKKLTIQNRISFANSRVESLTSQITQQKLSKLQALDAARQTLAAARVGFKTAELDYTRVKSLHEKGLASRREFEQATLRRDSTEADQLSAEANLKRTENDFESVISSIEASREAAKSEIANAERDLLVIDISLNQNERQTVTAPRDGIILSVTVTEGSYLQPGAAICTIIPETDSRFVQVWVDGNDAPLIQARREVDGEVIPGSDVRLAFEGWPAIQIVGWPQVATGTFGGEVVFIDATDDGMGRFRVVVGPKEDEVDRIFDGKGPVKVNWPDPDQWLRQGVQAKAWILLDQVPLWFELWRQINGFPPIGEGVSTEVASNNS
ncbi:MAG: HlyD family efflux transporter periplasmic adaptor subunit [Verrucomicrobiota bacterium]